MASFPLLLNDDCLLVIELTANGRTSREIGDTLGVPWCAVEEMLAGLREPAKQEHRGT